MSTDTRVALIVLGVVGVAITAVALNEAIAWRRQREAQCAAAKPLVSAHADVGALRRLEARRAEEYSASDAEWLIRQFGESSGPAKGVRQHLRDKNRAVLFHQDNSFMLVYVDGSSRAFLAECFFQ